MTSKATGCGALAYQPLMELLVRVTSVNHSTFSARRAIRWPGEFSRRGQGPLMAMMMRGAAPGPTKPLKPDTVRRVIRTFAPYKHELILTAVAVLASAALGLLSPF